MTLVELVAGIAVMSILAGAMMSAMIIASHAMPERNAVHDHAVSAMDAVDRLAEELTYATAITSLSGREIIFTVADRGDDPVGAETIRYAWSGSPGAPLVRQYNGGTSQTLVDRAAAFSITPTPTVKPVSAAPRVVMVVADEAILGSHDQARLNLLQSWGFDVQLMSDDRAATDLSAAVPYTDVVYFTSDIGNVFNWTIPDVRVGAVIECCSVSVSYGISLNCSTVPYAFMTVVDNQHEILAPFSAGANLSLTTSSQALAKAITPATDAKVLGRLTSVADVLVALEIDKEPITGGRAKARRVRLPWGTIYSSIFPFAQTTEDARTILRRSLVWASATPAIARARIALQPDDLGASAIETEVVLLNQPGDPRP